MRNRKFAPLETLAFCALLFPLALRSQPISVTATGWVNSVLAPGIPVVNASGQLLVHGHVHTVRVQSSDPRIAGQLFIVTDGAYNPDGTANVQGPGYLQLGAWDETGTVFTPTGEMWDVHWSGLMQTNYSMNLNLAGYGVGGSIEGLRLQEVLTRGPATGPTDTNVPYLYTGTITPAPLCTNLASVTFDGSGPPVGWTLFANSGKFLLQQTNGMLYTRANWSGCPSDFFFQNMCFLYPTAGASWNLANGQTLECQTDLIGLSGCTNNTATVWVGDTSQHYALHLGQHAAFLVKGSGAQGSSVTVFWCDNTLLFSRANVSLYLSLTRDQNNVIITTRVLDANNRAAVLFERSFVDTPLVEPSLTTSQFRALTGITNVVLTPDSSGPPILSSSGGGLGIAQLTDGHQPMVEALFDNFLLRLSDVSPISIARAVRLTYPVPAGVNYLVEAGPTVLGPWLPLQDLSQPGLGQKTALAGGQAQFFRLVQAP